ncbi:MAG: NPXTG-anchored protein [Ruminococcus sp.]|nr:NPXTG-anchored protein [Ruminococcus sp.]
MKKLFVGMTAAAIAASCMSISAFAATKLTDVVHPDENDKTMNDSYYGIGCMGYFMSQSWKWNQGDWIGWSEEQPGKLVVEYKISKAIVEGALEGKGTLGDMGVMVCNLPDNYPFEIKITDAKFVAEDGTETVFDSINSMTEATEDPEGNFRIHIRPADATDEATGEVTIPARPEAAGWDQEGGFEGGTLYMTIDFGAPEAAGGDESSKPADESSKKADDSSKKDDDSSKKADDSSKKDDSAAASTTKTTGTTTTTPAGGGSDNTAKAAQPETGAAEGLIFAGVALAGAALVVTKRK